MTFFGVSITRRKAAPAGLSSVYGQRGWFPLIRESFTGAWQRNVELRAEDVLTYAAVYACVTLIASDIGKLRIKLVEQDAEGVWTETDNPAYSPVLRKPNHYQTRIKFLEQWMLSKFIHGNTYILKQRDQRGVVMALYVLDPQRVKPLVAPNGDVYYSLDADHLSRVGDAVTVPAREIIHDVIATLYHPLVGVSPLSACWLSATQGIRAQQQSSALFSNGSTPGGVVTMPDEIDDAQARDIQRRWEEQFSGNNSGRVAVLGLGMAYTPLGVINAHDAQLVEQLKLTSEHVCTAYHVPPYMIGVGPPPNYNNIEALNQQYYSQTLQNPIESLEVLLDEGLEMKKPFGTEMELDDLMRMDTLTRVRAAAESLKGGLSPDEARKKFFDLGSVVGGGTPYLQQQNFSLEALAKRDAKADPFATGSSSSSSSSEASMPMEEVDMEDAEAERQLEDLFRKAFVMTRAA